MTLNELKALRDALTTEYEAIMANPRRTSADSAKAWNLLQQITEIGRSIAAF